MSFWVLGTDTDVGKTIVSSLILLKYAHRCPIAYWKPVSTGGLSDRDFSTVKGRVQERVLFLPELYLFEEPVSPHLAARLEGQRIQPDMILEQLVHHGLNHKDHNMVIEAAGGVFVPLNDDGAMSIQVVAESTLPAIVVARSTLGTINHTLLTLEALRQRSVPILGVVLNGPFNQENRSAIHRFGKVEIISEVPWVESEDLEKNATLEKLAEDFDPKEILAQYLCDEN